LGSYGDALKSAARRGKLGDSYRVAYIEREPGKLEQLLDIVSGSAVRMLADRFDIRLVPAAVPLKVAHEVDRDLGRLAALVDTHQPYTTLVHCLCSAP
jgi:protease-4